MVHSSSALEHDLEAFQELTTQLNQIADARQTAAYQLGDFASQRQQLVEAMDFASEFRESMNQVTEAVEQINEYYFGPDGAWSEAIESANMASEFAQEINNLDFLDDLELASTRLAATSNLATARLAATSDMTRGLSEQLAQSPMYNLGTIQNPFHNSDLYEVMQATEEISEMFDDLAWMGAEASMYQEPTTPEPGYREAPFHEEARETQNLLVAYLWAAISDSGEFASELSEEEKMRTRIGLSVLVGLVVGTLSGVGTSQFVHPILGVTSGLTAGISTGSAVATRLDNWYDMKRRQWVPADE